MKPLAQNTSRMKRSGIRELMDLAWATPGAIHLEVGEPDFPTPDHIVEAACRAAMDGFTKYTPNAGITPLREAIVRKFERKNKIEVTLDNIVVTPGAVCSMATSLLALIDHEDEVLIPDPGWPNYEMMVLSQGGVPVGYPLDRDRGFKVALDAFESKISPKTKVIILNSPSNPTGGVLQEETLKSLMEIASKWDLYVISDEIYEDIIYTGEHISTARFDSDGRVLTVSGVSKSYAMTGWRIGYVAAPLHIAQVIAKIQEPYVSCPVSVSQVAAQAALEGPEDCVKDMVKAYKERRDAVLDILQVNDLYSYTPEGAFYLLVDVSRSGIDSYSFSLELLKEKKVAVAPGEAFGIAAKDYIRISFGAHKDNLIEGTNRLCDFIWQKSSQSETNRVLERRSSL